MTENSRKTPPEVVATKANIIIQPAMLIEKSPSTLSSKRSKTYAKKQRNSYENLSVEEQQVNDLLQNMSHKDIAYTNYVNQNEPQ